jgi:hypothetical protein
LSCLSTNRLFWHNIHQNKTDFSLRLTLELRRSVLWRRLG